ncbi:PadR family transcriptional regulator [Paenibacillus mucilaginosus]|uniref:Transcriptional regulator, PadR-like family n=1 Tax=Paenibacillus mucilaginosus (strain KNP414) TaxID=1036673 RepID=F8F7Z8_PAEMK|nr:PadR family transcriptional regulator [Paenibacillus mucilaginosus]AEI40902.1 transcriptional regulator, PadR-like family [Paenibacillus mucilaginosus KNP414]MCG7211637.1 PadR family transcriptional regulator [Paenibacillus mucilaginosus]WDM30004.1 PadR family transcriptional regulator [Paenibacillus mucilaginosus]
MYELFVLGELSIGPKHGYELQYILKSTIGPFRQISSGTLYPLMSRLVASGFITQRDEPQEGGRPRKRYELTEAGRQRFHELMAAPLEHGTDIGLTFQFKLNFFGYVDPRVQLDTLEQYLGYLQADLKYIAELEPQVRAKPGIPEPKRAQVLRMFSHRRCVTEAEIGWVTEEIDRLKRKPVI